jgi:2-dehydro-3-deoxyphosphooctonate aldolase (KDO 8-P synthase)
VTREVRIGGAASAGGGSSPLLIIAGPCVIESEDITREAASRLKEICGRLGLGFVFKSSYDKANRTSISSFRGPGMEKGLRVLEDIRSSLGVPVMSDVHSVVEAKAAAEVLDALQVPAFLCRQTDILTAAARSGKPVNVKKGQFLAPWDMRYVIEKLKSAGTEDILVTERGTSFGYNNLVVDFRGLPLMRAYGYPVVFDVTHSLQLPGGMGSSTGGQREFAGPMMRAAAAAGVDALFMEVHPEPEAALCDGPNMIRLGEVERLLKAAKAIHEVKA